MGFLGVYRALFDYVPQAEGELAISEGDLLYLLDKEDDDGWWKAKKKAGADEDDEPEGLVPNNYVEKAPTVGRARAIYDYTRQTDEELSFPEDALLDVFDTSDPDWILVGLDSEYGFAPSNYIETQTRAATDSPSLSPATAPTPATKPQPDIRDTESADGSAAASLFQSPAAALAGVMAAQGRPPPPPASPSPHPPSPPARPTSQTADYPWAPSEGGEGGGLKSPALPMRPSSRTRPNEISMAAQPTAHGDGNGSEPYRTPGGFHMYNINEMVSVMGKRKKMPTTLGINLGTGSILIAPERAQDDPAQEWSADKMTHYSREGKHVFLELVRPSRSIDFHAGAKDTAEEIIEALGELASALRAEGLREVILSGPQQGQRKGKALYDFAAQGDDEVAVAAGDEVIILDDSKSQDWWQIRRMKNGKQGVVPSSYIEDTTAAVASVISAPPPPPNSSSDSARATVEQNRLEEIRLTKEAMRTSKDTHRPTSGHLFPEVGGSNTIRDRSGQSGPPKSRRESSGRVEGGGHGKAKSRPDSTKVRTWTDRTGSFSVEAQFLGLKDGKIHLHKMNGVKIAVPIAKMSREDLEYVENSTGISLDDEKPLADVKKAKSLVRRPGEAGATVGRAEKLEYDWFQFFLSCEVAVGLCERYAQAFIKDSMDESVLPDVNAAVLRTLGLREGDIIKVMRTLDAKFGRERSKQSTAAEGEVRPGGLFSGPGGALRNNTRKGRPAPAVQTNDVIDAASLSTIAPPDSGADNTKLRPAGNLDKAPSRSSAGGFDDDAWDSTKSKAIKESAPPETVKSSSLSPKAAPNSAQGTTAPTLTGSMKELSLLSEPLAPTPARPVQLLSPLVGSTPPPSQPTVARQRPAPPAMMPNQQKPLVPPPPLRSVSASQSVQQPTAHAPPLVSHTSESLQPRVAAPGQSLSDLRQARLEQQYAAQLQQLQAASTGFVNLPPPGVASLPMGAVNQQHIVHPASLATAFTADAIQPAQFPLVVGHQPTGFQPAFGASLASYGQGPAPVSVGGVNSMLPQPLEPQRTAAPIPQSQQLGTAGVVFTQPLRPQKTGPAPPVRFGMTTETKPVAMQPTGRRANLAQASM